MKNFTKTKASVLGIYHFTALMAAILVAFSGCTKEDDFIAVATLTATISNGASKNTPFTKDFSITVNDDFVAVADISGVPTEVEVEVPLTFIATVTPTNATNQTIAWPVKDAGTTGVSITAGNTLTATADETATVFFS